MKVIKSIGLVLLVLLLLVSVVSASNHTVAFWRLIKEKPSPYLYMYEDFSDLTWRKVVGIDGLVSYYSQSNIRVIPQEGSFSTDNGYLTVYDDEGFDKIIQIKIPYENVNSKENLDLDKLSYIVVTYELWTDTVIPERVIMRPYVRDSNDHKAYVGSDWCSLYNKGLYMPNSSTYSTFTFADKITLATSSSSRDRICCVVAVDPEDVSKTTVSYYVNGIGNELTYEEWITSEAEYLHHYEVAFKSPYSSSISIDNFSLYAFDRSFKGDIKDVLKEVNYK